MKPFNPPLRGKQSDSVAEALEEYDALARLAISNPELGRHPFIATVRRKALERLISLSEAV